MPTIGRFDGQAGSAMGSVEVTGADRRRAKARGRDIALVQGIEVPVGWWRESRWQAFNRQLPGIG